MDFQKLKDLGNEYIATEADALKEKSAASAVEFIVPKWLPYQSHFRPDQFNSVSICPTLQQEGKIWKK